MKCFDFRLDCLLLILVAFIKLSNPLSLYSPDDPLWEIDVTNFNRVIHGKSNAWIIEFYNNWCGHCIRFAPTWKQFARDIKTWKNVVDVAVVNCAESQNTKLCRNHGVEGFPSIRLFKPFANESYIGESYDRKRNINSMEEGIITFLESLWEEDKVPDGWPELEPIEFTDIRSIRNSMSDTEESIILFVESPESFVGRKVILDLSFQSSVQIRRVLTTNSDLLSDLKTEISNTSVPVVLKVYRDGNEELIFRFSKDVTESDVRDKIFQYFVGQPRTKADLTALKPGATSTSKERNTSFVHMTDLENAIHYLLHQEVGVVSHIYGDRLQALKSFISALKTYFPGEPPVTGYLSKVNDWIKDTNNITGEDFVKNLNELKTKTQFLPEMKDWVSCKGSEPKYRGYPCSLWTLFHTLTVQAYTMLEQGHGNMKKDVLQLLPTIKNYIKNFFTCEDCAAHFAEMAENMEDELKSPQDVVLWLWKAHNKVNRRLAGDITEDPKHPKIQFPSLDMCPKCRIEENGDEIVWDNAIVLRFLLHFYGKENIVHNAEDINDLKIKDGSIPSSAHVNYGNSSMGLKFTVSPVSTLLMVLLCYAAKHSAILHGFR